MKTLKQYIKEKLIVNKDYKSPYTCVPTSCDELRKIIEDRYNKFGPGTKNDPIDFNDVDVSNVNSFYNDNINIGIFLTFLYKTTKINHFTRFRCLANSIIQYYIFFFLRTCLYHSYFHNLLFLPILQVCTTIFSADFMSAYPTENFFRDLFHKHQGLICL